MEEDRIISPELEDINEEKMENSLRPKVLDEYIGQDKVKEQLEIFIEAAKSRNEPLDHVLLYGPPGLGKTTLANIISNEMKSNIKITSGPAIEKPGDLAALLTNLSEFDVLFIDEIHTLIGNDAAGALDLANMFKEGLSRGSIKMIGATTTAEYDRYIVRDKAFLRRFERIDVQEPTMEMCVQILLQTLPKIEKQTGAILPYTDFIKQKLMEFIVNMTSEYKRVYELSSRYPDIALTILRQSFSNALYENSHRVSFKNIYDAIRFTKAVYPDVIKKELVIFAETFKDELQAENIIVDPNNYLAN